MRRSNLDLTGRLWSLPASQTKSGRAHVVPLTNTAARIINALPAPEPGHPAAFVESRPSGQRDSWPHLGHGDRRGGRPHLGDISLRNEASKGALGPLNPPEPGTTGSSPIAATEPRDEFLRGHLGEIRKHLVGRHREPHWYRALGFNGCSSHSGRRTFITSAAPKDLDRGRLAAGRSNACRPRNS